MHNRKQSDIKKLNEQSLDAIWENKPALARRLANASLKIGKSVDGCTNLAFVSQDLNLAEKCLRKAIELSHRPFLPRANLVLVLAAQGRFADALREHQKNRISSLRRSPSDFYFKRAKLLRSVENRTRASRDLETAMQSASARERKQMKKQWRDYVHSWSWAGRVWVNGKAVKKQRSLLE